MDALDELFAECETAARSVDSASDAVARADFGALLAAVRARPQPWFFIADPHLTVFATEGHPGHYAAPHDHGLWAVIACLAGREGSRRYTERDGRLVELGKGDLGAGEVHAIPADGIHEVFNCWREPNIVLHVYGGDFIAAPKRIWDPITGLSAERQPDQLLKPLLAPR